MRCPRCGSTRIGIIAGGQIQLKCMDCGYAWTPNLAPSGYVKVNDKLMHWTEVEAAKEKALSELRAILENMSDCDGVKPVVAKYLSVLDANDIIKVTRQALRQAEPRLRLKGQSFVERYSNSIIECINNYIKSSQTPP